MQSHHYSMAQADWPLLILQPMRLLAQHLNSPFSLAAHYKGYSVGTFARQ